MSDKKKALDAIEALIGAAEAMYGTLAAKAPMPKTQKIIDRAKRALAELRAGGGR